MANCIWTSVISYIKKECGAKTHLDASFATELYGRLVNIFGWVDHNMHTQVRDEEWVQKLKYKTSLATAPTKTKLSRCCLTTGFTHQCDVMSVEKMAAGPPGQALKSCKKLVVDHILRLSRFLVCPQMEEPVGTDGAAMQETSGNVTITEVEQEISSWVEELPRDAVFEACNTTRTYSFPELMNRDILIANYTATDFSQYASQDLDLPRDYLKADCVPNALPMEAMVYGQYNLQLSVKINAHKFTSGLFYLSILPDPVLLHSNYEQAIVALQRKGIWIDLSQAPLGCLQVPFEFKRGLIRNSASPSEASGVTPAVYAKAQLHCIVPAASGTNMDKRAKIMVFARLVKADLAGMSMNYPVHAMAQGPIRTFVQPFRDFAGYVAAADSVVGEALDFLNADKPPALTSYSSFVPKPRMFFPNSKGVSESTVLRSNPSATASLSQRLNTGGVNTLHDIARVWGFLQTFKWTPTDDIGKEILRLPLEPAYFADSMVAEAVNQPPPISMASRLAALWTGTIEFDLMFVGTDYHSGSLTVSYEYGRSSAQADSQHCQAYSYQYDLMDIGTKRRYVLEAPYVYDTPWRRVPTQGPYMSWYTQDASPKTHPESIWSIKMSTEGWLVVRVANQLKAADTVNKGLDVVVRVRAGKSFGLMGLVASSGRIVGGLTTVTDNMSKIKEQRKKKPTDKTQEHLPIYATEVTAANLKSWHSSVKAYKPIKIDSSGATLIAAKAARSTNQDKVKELERDAAEAKKLTALVRDREGQIRTLQNQLSTCESNQKQVVQNDQVALQDDYRRLKLEKQAWDAIINAPTRTPNASVNGSMDVGPEHIVGGQILQQYAYTKPNYITVPSDMWRQAREYGLLGKLMKWVDLPKSQAPNKDAPPLDFANPGANNPYTGIAVGERLDILDILRRPVQLYRGHTLQACKIDGNINDNYDSISIPLMPPQWTLYSAHNGTNVVGVTSNIHHPAVHVLSLFRHWRGSMDYTFAFYGMSDPKVPIYIFHVPHTGLLVRANPARFKYSQDLSFNRYYGEERGDHQVGYNYATGGLEGLGYATEVVIPSVNPTVTITAPYYSQNVQSVMNNDDWSKLGPARDRGDGTAGAIVIVSAQECKFDAYWSAGVDFEVGSYIGTAKQESLPLLFVQQDNYPNFPSASVFRSNLPASSGMFGRDLSELKTEIISGQILKPLPPYGVITSQMWAGVTSMVSIAASAVSVAAVQPFYAAGSACKEISSAMVNLAGNLNRTSGKVDSLVSVLETSVVNGSNDLAEVIEKVQQQVEQNFPMVKNSYMLVSAALDVWLLKTHQDASAISNVVVRWLMTAGLVSTSGVVKAAGSILNYLRSATQPRSQWSFSDCKDAAKALKTLILGLECFNGISIPLKVINFLDSVLTSHRILRIVWAGRVVAALVEFIKCLFSLIKKFIYWVRGAKDPEVRIYYMLTDRNADFVKFIGKVQKFLTPETRRLLKISPKLRMEFYATGEIVKVVERVMAKSPRELNNVALTQMMNAFKKVMREMSQVLATAPVKYEPFMMQMYGATNIGKSYTAGKFVEHHLSVVQPEVFAKPIIYRTPGQEFWTDVDGVEVAVIVDESTHLDTEQDNRGLIADVYSLKSPAKTNPNQASEDRKDVCINPIVAIFLANVPEPEMNEVRDQASLKRRFDVSVEVKRVPNIPMDETNRHLRFRVVREKGELKPNPELTYDEFVEDYKRRVEAYHQREVANVKHRTNELMRSVGREDEVEAILKDPWSVYYRHLYGVCRSSNRDVTEAMEAAAKAWITELGCLDEMGYITSQGPRVQEIRNQNIDRNQYLKIRLAEIQGAVYENKCLQGRLSWDHNEHNASRYEHCAYKPGISMENMLVIGPKATTIQVVPSLPIIDEGLMNPQFYVNCCEHGCPPDEICDHMMEKHQIFKMNYEARKRVQDLWQLNHGRRLLHYRQECRKSQMDEKKRQATLERTLEAAAKRRAAERLTTKGVQTPMQHEVAAVSMAITHALTELYEKERQPTDHQLKAALYEAAPVYVLAKEILREDTKHEQVGGMVAEVSFIPLENLSFTQDQKKLVDEVVRQQEMGEEALDEKMRAWRRVIGGEQEPVTYASTSKESGYTTRPITTQERDRILKDERRKKLKEMVRELKETGMENRSKWEEIIREVKKDESKSPGGVSASTTPKKEMAKYMRYLFNSKISFDEMKKFFKDNEDAVKAQKMSVPQQVAALAIELIFSMDYFLTVMAEDFGVLYGDCTHCKATCVPVLPFCDDISCNSRLACVDCLKNKAERHQCPECKQYYDNPAYKGRLARYIFTVFSPILNLVSIPPTILIMYLLGALQAWEGKRERWCFLGLYLITALLDSSFMYAAFPLIHATKVLYAWAKSPNIWIPKRYWHCGFIHHVKNGAKLIWNGLGYLCEKCYHPHARAQAPLEDVGENDVSSFIAGCIMNFKDLDPKPTKIKSTLARPCAHLDLCLLDPDNPDIVVDEVGYRMQTCLSFRDGSWVITTMNGEIVVKNAVCGEKCILKKREVVRHMLISYADFCDHSVIHANMQQGDGQGVPIQIIPDVMLKKGFMSDLMASVHNYLDKFKNSEWWSWVKNNGLKWIGKLAAVSAAVLFILAGIYKLYKLVFGPQEPIPDDIPDDDCIRVEEVLTASQMTNISGGAALPRQRFNRGRRLGKPRAQISGGEGLVNIMGCVMNNQAVLVVKKTDGTQIMVVGLAIAGQYMLIPKHYLPALEQAQRAGIEIQFMNGTITYNYTYSPRDFRSLDDNDLVMFKMPPQVHPKKDLRPHFHDEEWYSGNNISRRGYIAVPPIGKQPCFMLQRLEIAERVSTMNVMEADGSGTYTILDSVAYNFSLPGACGSVIYQDTPYKPIIGIHVAGAGSYIDGRGYGLIVTREMIEDLIEAFADPVVVPDLPPVVPVAQIMTSMVDTNVEYLGGIEKERRCVQPMKTHIVPSVIADRIDHVPERLPVPLGPNEGIYKDSSWTPLTAGIVHMGAEVADIPTHEDMYVAAALDKIVAPMRSLVVNPKPLSVDEMVKGTEVEFYDAIDMSTSAGWPYSVEASVPNKTPWIDWDRKTGKVNLNPTLEADMKRKQQLRHIGRVPVTVFADIMKDERKKIASTKKVGGTRIISMSPLDFTLTVRQFYLHFMAAFMSGRRNLMHAVGITPDGPEWTEVHTRLKKMNPDWIWTIDYSNFGPGFSSRAAAAAYSSMAKWTRTNVKMDAKDAKALDIINRELYNSVHLYDCMLYRQGCGSPSGAAVTVIINTQVHLYYILWAFMKIAEDQPRLQSMIEQKGLVTAFRDIVEYIAYGDDGIAATKPEWLPYINAQTVSAKLATIGVVATDGTKGSVVTAYTPYSEAQFLKRGFLQHPEYPSHQLAPLPVSVIKETAMFVHSTADPIEMTSQVANASLLNAYGRGPEFYEKWYDELVLACGEAKVALAPLSWHDLDTLFFGRVRAQAFYAMPTQGPWTTTLVSDALVYESVDVDKLDQEVQHISKLVELRPEKPTVVPKPMAPRSKVSKVAPKMPTCNNPHVRNLMKNYM